MSSTSLRTSVASAVKRLLGDRRVGQLDFWRFPGRGSAWGGPFNGQQSRQRLFQEIIGAVKPAFIVETGTYLGTTTEFMSVLGLPTYTIENNERNYGFCLARFRRKSNIFLRLGDSREILHSLLDGELEEARGSRLFFYLDAHWNEDLPLAEELGVIFSRCPSATVMIDDFEIPGDPGYAFDDYGSGKVLNADYIRPIVGPLGLSVFYPSTPSSEETGARRGCVVLCADPVQCASLGSLRLLRLG